MIIVVIYSSINSISSPVLILNHSALDNHVLSAVTTTPNCITCPMIMMSMLSLPHPQDKTLQQVGEQQRYGGSLAVEQCNNYTWVLTAVAEGGKSRDVQGEKV